MHACRWALVLVVIWADMCIVLAVIWGDMCLVLAVIWADMCLFDTFRLNFFGN